MRKDEEILGELAGSASLCWQPRPTGVFDSTEATKFVTQALSALREYYRLEIEKAIDKLNMASILDDEPVKTLVAKDKVIDVINKVFGEDFKLKVSRAVAESNRRRKCVR